MSTSIELSLYSLHPLLNPVSPLVLQEKDVVFHKHKEPKGNCSEEKEILLLQRKTRLTGLKSSHSSSESADVL